MRRWPWSWRSCSRRASLWPSHHRLVVDAALEAGWAPVHELNGTLGLDRSHSCVHILPRYIMQQAMYLPWRGSHFTIMEAGSKTDMVISCS
eukprot:Skav217245  [mRNA]  locus=scaffold110:323808:324773:+ [translate_table: standard]